MEVRILIAYLLIGLMAAMAALLVRHVTIKRRDHRRLMRGHGTHNRASAARPEAESKVR